MEGLYTVALGLISVYFGVRGVMAIRAKKNILTVLFGITSMICISSSVYFWRLILIASGKNVTRTSWYGLKVYPRLFPIIAGIFLVGLACFACGAIRFVLEKKNAGKKEQ